MVNIFLTFFKISVSTSVIIIILILFSPFLNKYYASKWKYWIWVFLALWLIIPFGEISGKLADNALSQLRTQITLTSEKEDIENIEEQFQQEELHKQIIVEIPSQITTPILISSLKKNISITLLDIIAFVWLLGSLFFLFMHLISYFYYKRQVIKKGACIKDSCILCQMFELKQELHIKDTICIIEYPEAASPMIIGFFKLILILPEEQYTSEELFFILKHELVHCKRKDVYAKLLFVVAKAVHWFNPLIWIMQKEAAIDMELSCDEKVTKGVDYAIRKAYTETLLSTLHKKTAKGTVLSTQFYGETKIMKKRFKNILNKVRKKNGVIILIGTIILTIGAGTLIGCSAAEVSNENEREDISANIQPEAVYKKPENILLEDSLLSENNLSSEDNSFIVEVPQNGQVYGYISKFDNISVTIDRQIWVTSESEDWKPEYNEAAGFEVVDAKEEDIVYPISENCTYSILENHYHPVIELDKKEFESCLSEMEYPILWIIQLENGQVIDITEQYLP